VHRLRDQRAAVLPLHAEEPQLVQVPRLAAGRLVAVRVLHHGHDRHEHHHSHDEGLCVCVRLGGGVLVRALKLRSTGRPRVCTATLDLSFTHIGLSAIKQSNLVPAYSGDPLRLGRQP